MSGSAVLAARIGRRQLGLVTRRQLLDVGLGKAAIDRRITNGTFVRMHPGVYRLAATSVTLDRLFLAAVLAAGRGAAISHRAAASIWGLEAVRAVRPEISIPIVRRLRLKGVVVHRTHLSARDITKRGPFTVTTPARTLVDLAAVLLPPALEDALDDGLRRKLFAVDSLKKQIEGRTRNTSVLRRLLAERTDGKVSGSRRENALRRLLVNAKLPKPEPQYEVRTPDGSFVARVDFAYPDQRLAIEYDGQHHADRRQWHSDLTRQNRLINAGWRILRYTHDDLVHRPDEVVFEVKAALGTAV